MELKQGTIYKYIYTNQYLISECTESNTKKVIGYLCIEHNNKVYRTWNNVCSGATSVVLATEEEKQWYLACKKANKFIEKEEALKSFKQETNLVGRYIKWLVDANYCKVFEKGEYSLITSDKGGTIKLENYETDFADLTYNKYNWELMPEGFIPPNIKEKPMDLLTEAKKRFPPGITFKSPQSGNSYTIPIYCNFYKENEGIRYNTEGKQPWIYYNGKWAEIISETKQPKDVQQVEVVPLQKPCIISTRKSKLNLIKL